MMIILEESRGGIRMCKENSIGLISKYIQTSGGLEAVGREVKQFGKLTGMASSLANSGNQLAIAHYFYNCITKFFKEQQAKFFHGELVSLGLSLQMKINRCPNADIEQYKSLLRSINLPTILRDIQLGATEKNLSIIGEYISSKIKCGEEDKRLIWNSMQSMW